MNKIIISILLACLSLHSVEWLDYDEARKLQEKNNKIIMIDVVRSLCHYCSDMEAEVFNNFEMIKYLNKHFILAKVNLDTEVMPLGINPTLTPSFYFINKNEKIVKKINGSWNIEDFKFLTKDIR